MPIPDFQSIMLPLLQLSSDGKEWRIADATERLSDAYSLTPEEKNQLIPSGRARSFNNRVAWAKVYLSKAGLITPTKRAHFVISGQGRKVLSSPPDRITIKFLTQFPEFQEFRKESTTQEDSPGTPSLDQVVESPLAPDEMMRNAHAQLEQVLAGELLQKIHQCTPAFFENLVVRLLFAMGYGGSISKIKESLVGGPGDGGVDGVIDQDPLGLDRVYVQAKRYVEGNAVGASAIREFFGSLDRFKASKGLFVTASSYTSSAKETATALGKRIVLIDGSELTRLMIRHNVGCRVEETLDIKEIDEEFFE
jgi:restriction system protein